MLISQSIQNLKLFTKLPGFILAKDIESKYLAMSNDFARIAGWASPDQSIGKADYDSPCRASEFANIFISQDKQVIQTCRQMLTLDIQHYATGWHALLTKRDPIKNAKGQIEGLLLSCIDVSNTHVFKVGVLLNDFDQKIVNTSYKPASYVLSEDYVQLPLTPVEQDCLFLLLRGKSLNQISNILNLSVKIIDNHFNSIKYKLNCDSLSEVAQKAIDKGFLHYIPQTFLVEKFH